MVYVQEVLAVRGFVIIPAFNEEMRIGHIVGEAKAKGLDCIVIDDGSADKTKEEAKDAGADVICHTKNLGKGVSLRDGFKKALEKGCDFVITMDGDGQHHPGELEGFVRAAEKSGAAVILGNRMGDPKGMPLKRKLTNWVMSSFISLIAGQRMPDTQCGYRLIRAEVLKAVPLTTDKYEIESELLIGASKAGFKIESIPIKSIYGGEKSQIHPFVDTIRFLSFIIKTAFKK
jgi:glycosyltransferase involved in cell wall biosynthesis